MRRSSRERPGPARFRVAALTPPTGRPTSPSPYRGAAGWRWPATARWRPARPGGSGGGPGGRGGGRARRQQAPAEPEAEPRRTGGADAVDLRPVARARARGRGHRRARFDGSGRWPAAQPQRGRRGPFSADPGRDGHGHDVALGRHDRAVCGRDRRQRAAGRCRRTKRSRAPGSLLREEDDEDRPELLRPAAARGDRHGPRRPRQDDPARPDPGVGRRLRRDRRDHPAHRCLPGDDC